MLDPGAERRSGRGVWGDHGFPWSFEGRGLGLVEGQRSGRLAGPVGWEDRGGADMGPLMEQK